MSNNAETTILATNPPNNVVASPGSDGVEIPQTIPMSGDDVEDDLTIGTIVAEGEGAITQLDNDKVASASKTGPYFSDSMNDQEIETLGDSATGISKTVESMEVSKLASVQGLPLHQSSLAPRVSLSPPPGLNATRPTQTNLSQASLFSPIGHVDGTMDDDNSIVIPGVPACIANMNTAANGATSGTTVGSVRPHSVSQTDKSYDSLSTMRDSAECRSSPALISSQKSLPFSAKNPTTWSSLAHSSNSRDIGKFNSRTEKVQFSATTTAGPNDSSSFKKSKVSVYAPLANSEFTASKGLKSTAITPDHRQGVANDSALTPSSRYMNGNDGGAITPTPHKVHAQALTAEAPAPAIMPLYDASAADVRPVAMEIEPPSKQPPHTGRSRSPSIYSPTPSAAAESVTPKACNANPTSNENFDELLSEFVNYIQEGADIYEKGQSDLLELEVDLSHAFAAALRYKDEYTNLLSEIEAVQAMAESITQMTK